MTERESKRALQRLQESVGAERLLNALSQDVVKHALQLRSKADLATELGVPYETLRSWVTTERIPKPEFQLHRRFYYSPEQAKAITEMVIEDRKNKNLTYRPKSG